VKALGLSLTSTHANEYTTVPVDVANLAHQPAPMSVPKRTIVKDATATLLTTTRCSRGRARTVTGTRIATLKSLTNAVGLSGETASTTMLEADLERTIVDAAKLLGWHVAHFRPAQNGRGNWRTPVAYDGAGFPDLVLVRERLIVAELKSDKGRVSAAQQKWLDMFINAGVETYVWRPNNMSEALTILQTKTSATLAESVEVVPSPLVALDHVPGRGLPLSKDKM